ncbi:MAG: hypothetical protein ABII18_11980 [bacterium]
MGVIQGLIPSSLLGFQVPQCMGLGVGVKSQFQTAQARETTGILYKAERPHLISRIVEGYAVLRDEAACSRKQLQGLIPSELKDKLQDHRAYVLPGFLNFNPGLDFLRTTALACGHGAALISVAPSRNVREQGRFARIGGRGAYFHPEWKAEVATIVDRLGEDLIHQKEKGVNPAQLIIMGHSKGGMLVWALGILRALWEENFELDASAFDLFPGLAQVYPQHLEAVREALKEAILVPIGTPLNGLPKAFAHVARFTGFDWFTSKTSETYMDPYIQDINLHLGGGYLPEDVLEHAVYAFQPHRGLHKNILFSDEAGLRAKAQAYVLRRGAGVFFNTLGLFQNEFEDNDGLVPRAYGGEIENTLLIPANHITVVEDPINAVHVLKFITNEN